MTGVDSDTIQQSHTELFPESGVNMKTVFTIQFITDKDRVKQFADYIPVKKNFCLRVLLPRGWTFASRFPFFPKGIREYRPSSKFSGVLLRTPGMACSWIPSTYCWRSLEWTSIPTRGSRNICSRLILQKPEYALAWWATWLLCWRLFHSFWY